MNYIEVSIECDDATIKEVLIAILSEQGYEGFEEVGNELKAYIQEAEYNRAISEEIKAMYGVSCREKLIAQQNWNEQWEQSFNPVRVGDFCTVRASFHEADTTVAHDIVITPKMSFGTGHHATTRLMIECMKTMDLKGKTVLDFGTGTGVLAILAHKLGAGDVVAIDNDEWSYENVKENTALNNANNIEILKGSLEVAENKNYDIILANINRHILMHYMQQMQGLLKEGGLLAVSGILEEDIPLITTVAENAGLSVLSEAREDKWACLCFS